MTPLRSHAIDVQAMTVAGPGGPLDARLYRGGASADRMAETLLVFFHGGGFATGGLDASEPCMRDLAGRLDAALLAPTYSQAPDLPFPAAAEDAYAVVADCAAHPKRYRWTGRTLIVGGIEAGGNLAAVAALMARDRGGPPLAGQILMVPMLDPGLSSGSMRCAGTATDAAIASRCAGAYRDYLPRAADRIHPYACPLATTRMKGLPPTLMISIDGDPLRDEADAYVAKLVATGIPVETLVLPTQAGSSLECPTARCRASSDDHVFDAIAGFVASIAVSVPPAATASRSPAPLRPGKKKK